MRHSARLQSVLEIFEAVMDTTRPADALISGYFRARRYIGSKDRAAVSEMIYGLLRHWGRMSWWCAKFNVEPSARSIFLVYLRLKEKLSPQAIETAFDGSQFAPSVLSDEEKRLLKKCVGHTLLHPNMSEAITLECPPEAEAPLRAKFKENFAKEMQALLEAAPLDLRVNPLKTTREEALAVLQKEGFTPELTLYSPYGLRLHHRPALNKLSLLKDGHVEIQDEGSQLVALLVEPSEGERIVDFCAGAGGKTLAMAAEMKNKGRIIACDVMERRLARSTERFKRAGLFNIETRLLKSETDPWVKRHKESFDRVLVDAPCSGTGTWRRNPDGRWRSLGPGLEALCQTQQSILQSASRLVKKGGRLVYATCSLLPEENEKQIEMFLAANPDFSLLPLCKIKPDWTAFEGADYLALSPGAHGTDGFFAAALTRKQD